MSDIRIIIEGYIERIASLLHEHLNLIEAIEHNTSLIESIQGPIPKSYLDSLSESIKGLSELRNAFIGDLSSLVSIIASQAEVRGLDDQLGDIYALAGYYITAGSEREIRALRRASRYLREAESEILNAEEATRKAENALRNIEKLRAKLEG